MEQALSPDGSCLAGGDPPPGRQGAVEDHGGHRVPDVQVVPVQHRVHLGPLRQILCAAQGSAALQKKKDYNLSQLTRMLTPNPIAGWPLSAAWHANGRGAVWGAR